ncbi:MAG: polyprenyl synthetase family protein [Labedaea sp.]
MTGMKEVTMPRPASEVFAWSRRLVAPALRNAVDTIPGPLRQIAGYHFGWCDEYGNPVETGGGRAIRPALTLLSALAVGGEVQPALPAAVAAELVHNFSLMHHDVLGGELTRRHRRSAWSVFGRRNAILAGDALLTLACDVLVASEHPRVRTGLRRLTSTVLELLRGQQADLAFECRDDVDLGECQHMAAGRAGALFGCACALGALFGAGTPAQVDHLRRFGQRLGLAAQHLDDLLGIWGDPGITGRPVYSDLDNRRKSLPIVAALTSGSAAGQELAVLYHRDTPLSVGELGHAAALVERAGGRAWSQAQTGYLLDSALRELDAAEPVGQPGAELAALARLVTAQAG